MKLFYLLFSIIFHISIFATAQDSPKRPFWKRQSDSSHVNYENLYYFQGNKQELLNFVNKQPYFSMYRDNYIITGIPLNRKVTNKTADAKFQISIRHRLTNTILPFDSFLVLTYTQKSFWDIYDESSPFSDNNYNPALMLVKPIIYHHSLRGMVSLSVEHESNGQAGEDSRSWNFASLQGVFFINKSFYAQIRVWYGWLLEKTNKDLYDYRGYGSLTLNYWTPRDIFWCSLTVNPCKGLRSWNTQLELHVQWKSTSNQYLFVQWYNGFGEELLDYKKYTSMVRIGICLKPTFRSMY